MFEKAREVRRAPDPHLVLVVALVVDVVEDLEGPHLPNLAAQTHEVSGNRSLAKPGSIPVVKHEDPPVCARLGDRVHP